MQPSHRAREQIMAALQCDERTAWPTCRQDGFRRFDGTLSLSETQVLRSAKSRTYRLAQRPHKWVGAHAIPQAGNQVRLDSERGRQQPIRQRDQRLRRPHTGPCCYACLPI